MFYTAMLAVSIPMIIFGAVLGLAASDHTTMSAIWVWIFIAGIFFLVTGLVFVPIFWVMYAKKKRLSRLAIVISGMKDSTIDIIGDTVGRTQEETRNDVRTLLRNGWLPGYTFVDQEDRVKRTDSLDVHHAVCDHCGASFEFRGTNAECPYCGRYHKGDLID